MIDDVKGTSSTARLDETPVQGVDRFRGVFQDDIAVLVADRLPVVIPQVLIADNAADVQPQAVHLGMEHPPDRGDSHAAADVVEGAEEAAVGLTPPPPQ